VGLYHLSWWRILTEAIVQHRHRGLADPDQAWILGELIAYLDHEKSGAAGFQDMGDKWVSVRNAAANGTLRAADPEAREVAARWDQFIDYLCLGLSQDLGEDVRPVRARKQSSEARLDAATKELADTGMLSGTIKVPDAVGPLSVQADLRTRTLSTSVAVDAPREGRPLTRVKWLTRQLKQAPGDLRIDARFTSARETSSVLLAEAREYPQRLLSASDPKREPRGFTLTVTKLWGPSAARATGRSCSRPGSRRSTSTGGSCRTCARGNPPRPSCPKSPSMCRRRPRPSRHRSARMSVIRARALSRRGRPRAQRPSAQTAIPDSSRAASNPKSPSVRMGKPSRTPVTPLWAGREPYARAFASAQAT
jgi:hypothetical protein